MQHLACIMDGNRRWAKKKGWLPWDGHREGAKAVERVVDFCLIKKIPYLSLYAFSIENFNRSEKEITVLFSLFSKAVKKLLVTALEKNIRVRFVGDRAYFPEKLIAYIEKLEQETVQCKQLKLNILFCYGARQEIVNSAKQIAYKVKTGELTCDDISEELFAQHMWTNGTPEPDLLIRTGGAKRLSNFLLYQAAYTELYFLDCFWPDITHEKLEKAVSYFDGCKRNFGE